MVKLDTRGVELCDLDRWPCDPKTWPNYRSLLQDFCEKPSTHADDIAETHDGRTDGRRHEHTTLTVPPNAGGGIKIAGNRGDEKNVTGEMERCYACAANDYAPLQRHAGMPCTRLFTPVTAKSWDLQPKRKKSRPSKAFLFRYFSRYRYRIIHRSLFQSCGLFIVKSSTVTHIMTYVLVLRSELQPFYTWKFRFHQ